MNAIRNLVPVAARRAYVDRLYGETRVTWFYVHQAALALVALCIVGVLVGFTPLTWPLHDKRIETGVINAPRSQCADFSSNAEDCSADMAATANASITAILPASGRSGIQWGDMAGSGTLATGWVTKNLCQLNGVATAQHRAMLAHDVFSNSGTACSWIDKRLAKIPLRLWLGNWTGIGITLALIALLFTLVPLRLRRVTSNRRAYQRLYASSHHLSDKPIVR